jgi:hypothetical protein
MTIWLRECLDVTVDRDATAAEWVVEGIRGYRWWSTAEMRTEAQRAVFSPRDLPELLDKLLEGDLTDGPQLLGL